MNQVFRFIIVHWQMLFLNYDTVKAIVAPQVGKVIQGTGLICLLPIIYLTHQKTF
jgi:hypothetical protein